MTAKQRKLAFAAVALLGLAIVWVWVATRLWRTSVPELEAPELDPRRFFSDRQLDATASYERFVRIDELLASLAQVVVLGLYAWKGERFARESAAGRIGTGLLLGMLGLAFVWLAQLPFGLAAQWWERKHDLSELGYIEWLFEDWLSLAGRFLFISLALLITMALASVLRRRWWLAAGPALVAVGVAFAFVQPFLIPELDRPKDERLIADARSLARAQGISGNPVRVQEVHEQTSQPNAEAGGFGPSQRVILWDTLLERFPRSEVRVVLAHEFAHLSRDHVWKFLAWTALLLVPVGLVVELVTRRRGGLYEPAAVPLAVFTVVLVLFLLTPVQSAFSQRLEREADWVALQTTREPRSAQRLFARFTREALAQPRPPAWSKLFQDHPSVLERIALAEAWRARHPGARPGVVGRRAVSDRRAPRTAAR